MTSNRLDDGQSRQLSRMSTNETTGYDRLLTSLTVRFSPSLMRYLAVERRKALSFGKLSLYLVFSFPYRVMSTLLTIGMKFLQGIDTRNSEL